MRLRAQHALAFVRVAGKRAQLQGHHRLHFTGRPLIGTVAHTPKLAGA